MRRAILLFALLAAAACGDEYPDEGEVRPFPEPPESKPDPVNDDLPPPGMMDLSAILDRVPEDPLLDEIPIAACRRLRVQMNARLRYVTPDEFKAAKRDLAEALAHLDRLKSDAAYRRRQAWRTWVSVHPIWRNLSTDVLVRPPWLVVYERPDGSEGEAARDRAAAAADRLAAVHEKLRKTLEPVLRLPAIGDLRREDERVLRVFLYASREAFESYGVQTGAPTTARAEYNPADRWLVGATGDRALRDLVAGAVRQLLHVYRKVLVEREVGGDVLWSDPRLTTRSLWIDEGITCLFDEEIGLSVDRISWRLLVEHGEWTLADFLRCRARYDLPDVRSPSMDLELVAREYFRSHSLPVHARFFVRFLCSREDYRKKLLAYLAEDLRGRSGHEVFAKIWFGDRKVDWTALEREWRAHIEKLVKK